MTAPTLTVQEILLGGADHILAVGHHQVEWFADIHTWRTCPCCADGAMCVTADYDPVPDNGGDPPPALVAAREELATYLIERGWPECRTDDELDAVEVIGKWNDCPGMNGEEVVRVLREVAELAS